MKAEDISQWAKQARFVPFEIQLTTGKRLIVRHPDSIIVTRHTSYVGLYRRSKQEIIDRLVHVANDHVVTIEALEANGSKKTRKKRGS